LIDQPTNQPNNQPSKHSQVSYPRCAVYNYKHKQSKVKHSFSVLLLRYFIDIAYLRNSYMFRSFFRSSSGWSYIPYEETIQYV